MAGAWRLGRVPAAQPSCAACRATSWARCGRAGSLPSPPYCTRASGELSALNGHKPPNPQALTPSAQVCKTYAAGLHSCVHQKRKDRVETLKRQRAVLLRGRIGGLQSRVQAPMERRVHLSISRASPRCLEPAATAEAPAEKPRRGLRAQKSQRPAAEALSLPAMPALLASLGAPTHDTAALESSLPAAIERIAGQPVAASAELRDSFQAAAQMGEAAAGPDLAAASLRSATAVLHTVAGVPVGYWGPDNAPQLAVLLIQVPLDGTVKVYTPRKWKAIN